MKVSLSTKLTLTILLVCITYMIGYAQPGNPSTPAPLGFLELILGAGIMYGGYKHYKSSRR